ncbi:MAG: rod shape-determining protein MreC [Tissierellia bacterium]|nr:rod shape-determining protein MreC [Tissierellia bacterium]
MLYYRSKESNKKHYIKIIVLIIIIISSSLSPKTNSVTSNILFTILRPINQATSYVTAEIQDTIDNVFGTKPNRDLVKKLQLENNELRDQVNRLKLIVNEEEILKREYDLSKKKDHIMANVIALDDKSSFNSFIINKGEKQAVKKGDIVVGAYLYKNEGSEGALIGKVEEVFSNSSRVVSIMDDKFNLTFMHEDTNKFGVVNSRYSGLLEGYMLDKATEVKKDDRVFTSGIGGVYNRGILIGNVVEVAESPDELSKIVKIESPIDFKRIYNVFVISNEGYVNE